MKSTTLSNPLTTAKNRALISVEELEGLVDGLESVDDLREINKQIEEISRRIIQWQRLPRK